MQEEGNVKDSAISRGGDMEDSAISGGGGGDMEDIRRGRAYLKNAIDKSQITQIKRKKLI